VYKHRLTRVGRAMKELGVHMIAGYSPQARGRSERSFGTWQGRLPQELRLAGTTTVEAPTAFCGAVYRGVQREVQRSGAGKGTALRRTGRSDLNWIFTVQTERAVDQDYTVAIRDRLWQIDKTRFRYTLAALRSRSTNTWMKRCRYGLSNSSLLWNVARRIVRPVISAKNRSTRFSQELLVG